MNWSLTLCVVLLLSSFSPAWAKDHGNSDGRYAWCWKEYGTVAVGGGITAVVAAVAYMKTGSTAAGVAAGSVAAGIQSAIYGGAVTSTSLFAALQSAGAAGMGLVSKCWLFSFGAGASAFAYIKNMLAPCEEGPKCSSDKE